LGYDVEDGQTHSFPSVTKSIPTPEIKKKRKRRKSQNAARPLGQEEVNQMGMSYHPDNAVNAHD
jgi:hypothetical protein